MTARGMEMTHSCRAAAWAAVHCPVRVCDGKVCSGAGQSNHETEESCHTEGLGWVMLSAERGDAHLVLTGSARVCD